MKLFSLLLGLTFMNFYALGISTIDNFSDGNFNQNPSWSGDSAYFKVNSAGELQSSGLTGGGNAGLSLPYTCHGAMHWQFRFRLLFNPSSTNYARIYLYANSPSLAQASEGLYLKTGGESGNNDRLELWHQSGTRHTQLWSGIAARINSTSLNELQVKIQLFKGSQWLIQSMLNNESDWITEGSLTYAAPRGPGWTGCWYTCTSTRATQLYFDDFLISSGPPSATQVILNEQQQLTLSFTQPINLNVALQLQHYQLLPTGAIQRADALASDSIRLQLALSQAGTYQFICAGIPDQDGINPVQADTFSFYWKPPVKRGDILITEIMFDPEPSAGLPPYEYIELYNHSDQTFFTEGLQISDGSTVVNLPTYQLAAGEYLLLVPAAAAMHYPTALSLNTWPSLNNDADMVVLYDDKGRVLHQVRYAVQHLPNDHRKDGGYSIEAGALDYWCKGEEIWSWSTQSNGGTPGATNAFQLTLSDTDGPQAIHAIQKSSTQINLYLNEAADTTRFLLSVCTLQPLTKLDQLYTTNAGLSWTLDFQGDTLQSYILQLSSLHDCVGNASEHLSIPVVYPRAPIAHSLEPSEILFNPLPYSVDFLEVYNNSLQTLDLRKCKAGSEAEGRRTIIQFPDEHILIAPHQYLALTPDVQDIRNHYPSAVNLYETSLPPFSDEEACVWMEDSNGVRLFEFCYSKKQHQQLLKDEEGVSLERISFSISEEDHGNWTSSASVNQYTTPGYGNSATHVGNISEEVTINPSTIEPGHVEHNKALVHVEFHPAQHSTFVRCRIYNENGNLTRELMNNHSVGEGSIITWEGVNEKGEAVHPGLYLVYTECWTASGYYQVYKHWIGVH